MGQRWAFALAVVTSMAQACGPDDSEPGGTSSGGTAGSGGQGGDASVVEADAPSEDAADPDCSLATVTFNLKLVDFYGTPLVGAKVTPSACREKAQTSDAKGSVALELPTAKAAWIEIEHADTLPTILGRIALTQTLAFALAVPAKSLAATVGYSTAKPMIWPTWWLPFAGAKLDRTGFVFDASPGSFDVTYLDQALSPISGATACDESGGAVLVGGAEGDVTLSISGGKFKAVPNEWSGQSPPVFIQPGWVTRVPIIPKIGPSDAAGDGPPPPPPPDAGGD